MNNPLVRGGVGLGVGAVIGVLLAVLVIPSLGFTGIFLPIAMFGTVGLCSYAGAMIALKM